MKHYKYGGSTAKRTEHCTAWVNLSEGIPKTVSDAANTGTAIHFMLESANLSDDVDFDSLRDTKCPETGLTIDRDMVSLAKIMWAADQALMDEYNVQEWEAETTGQYSDLVGSTVDKVAVGTTDLGQVTLLIDYKTGTGVQVDAVVNEQLLHNAWCLTESSEAQDLFEGSQMLSLIHI